MWGFGNAGLGAAASEVLRSFGKILDAEVEIDPALTAEVTVELEQVPVSEAMRQVCRLVGCSWSLETDPTGRRRLVVLRQ